MAISILVLLAAMDIMARHWPHLVVRVLIVLSYIVAIATAIALGFNIKN